MEVTINEIDVREWKAFLVAGQKEANGILSRAINKTLPGVRTDANDQVRKALNLKKSTVNKYMKISKSQPKSLKGVFDATSMPIPLINYAASPTKKGVTVQVWKDRSGGRTLIKHAFITTVFSKLQGAERGHKGVFWRVSEMRSKKKTKPLPTLPWKKFDPKFRLKIKELFGPRVPDALDDTTSLKALLSKGGERWDKAVKNQIDFFFTSQRSKFD